MRRWFINILFGLGCRFSFFFIEIIVTFYDTMSWILMNINFTIQNETHILNLF